MSGDVRVVGTVFLLRVMSGPQRGFGTVVFRSRFEGSFVFPAIVVNVGVEELRDEPFLVAVEVANVG